MWRSSEKSLLDAVDVFFAASDDGIEHFLCLFAKLGAEASSRVVMAAIKFCELFFDLVLLHLFGLDSAKGFWSLRRQIGFVRNRWRRTCGLLFLACSGRFFLRSRCGFCSRGVFLSSPAAEP